MTTNYRKEVLKTAVRIPVEDRLICSAFGLCVESGAVADLIKKSFFHGQEFERQNLLKELGDVLWYMEVACSCLNIELDESVGDYFNVENDALMKLSLKLCRRTGWFADHISEHALDKKVLNQEEIKQRLEDVFKCINELVTLVGSSVEEVREMNINKLKLLYPEVRDSET